VQAEASAEAEAIRLRKVAEAQSEAILRVNQAMEGGGANYLALRQLEMVPIVAPMIADALAKARLVNISSDGGGAANGATDQITSVIQTVLAAQLVTNTLKPDDAPATQAPVPVQAPAGGPAPAAKPAEKVPVVNKEPEPKKSAQITPPPKFPPLQG